MKIKSILFILLFSVSAFAQKAPLAAETVIKNAVKKAKKEDKNIFVIFHASWCGWCILMDKSIKDEACKPHFEQKYVIVHLDVLENKDKKHLENPGGEAYMNKMGGKGQGLPYWIVLDKKGNMLSDSKYKKEGNEMGQNLGCPAKEDEVQFLIEVLKKTSKIDSTALDAIADRFRKNAQ